MLTWTWARRLAPFRVQVNAVHPGAVLGTQLARDLALKRGTHTAEVSAGRVGSRLHTCVPCAFLCKRVYRARAFASCSGHWRLCLVSCDANLVAVSVLLPWCHVALFFSTLSKRLSQAKGRQREGAV